MKRKVLLCGFILVTLMFLGACKLNNNTITTITITTDVDSYSPNMSSAQGIEMTPHFKLEKEHKNLEYHWTTEEGSFIKIPNVSVTEVKNQGEPVKWSAIRDNEIIKVTHSFKIHLEVIDTESKKVLGNRSFTILLIKGETYMIIK